MVVSSSKLQIERKIMLFVRCSFVAYRSSKRREDWKVIFMRIAFSRLSQCFMNLDPGCRALAGIIAYVAFVEISVSGIGIRNHWNQDYGSSTNF